MERKINYFILFLLFYFIGASYSLICKFGKKSVSTRYDTNVRKWKEFFALLYSCTSMYQLYMLAGWGDCQQNHPDLQAWSSCHNPNSVIPCDESKIFSLNKYRQLPSPPLLAGTVTGSIQTEKQTKCLHPPPLFSLVHTSLVNTDFETVEFATVERTQNLHLS